MDFKEFDKKIDVQDLSAKVKEAEENGGTGDFPDIPKGTYVVKLEKMEVGATGPNSKCPGSPMLKVQFRITEGEFEKSCLFFNRVLYGTKNDANMIAGAVTFLNSLEPSDEIGEVEFVCYSDFADLVLDIAEDVAELEYEVEYDPAAFNAVKITDVFE